MVEQQEEQFEAETAAEDSVAVTKQAPVELETQPGDTFADRVPPDDPPSASPSTAAEPPSERFYSPGRRAEPRLWALLNAGRYEHLKNEVERLTNIDPRWQPPPELLHWLQHHLAEQTETAAPPAKPTQTAGTSRDPLGAAAARAVRLQQQGRPAAALETLDPWLPQIAARHDAERMSLVGWLRLETGDAQAALKAFERANQWRPTSDAAKGELLALAEMGDASRLLARAGPYADRWATLRSIAADSLRSLAARLHQQGRYRETRRLLNAASQFAPAGRETEMLAAWNLLRLGETRAAADSFERLYLDEPDPPSAEGLLNSLRRLGEDAKLARLAQPPGPLHRLWLKDEAQRLAARGDFVRAYRIDPEASPSLANVDSPAADLGARWRERSGEPGLGRLTETRLPMFRFSQWLGLLKAEVALERVSLDAGTARADATLGSAPNDALPEANRVGKASRLDNGLSWSAGLAYQGDWRLAAQLGQTPTEGALDAKLRGALTFGQRRAKFAWEATLAHQPVRESLLSYTGLIDPATGNAWGRVFRSGVSLNGWRQLSPEWTLAGMLRAHEYRGTEVADNSGIEAELSLGRNLQHPRFAYLTLGPAIEYRHFRRNLNHFTVGHGGYYSPDKDLGLMLALDFRTREAARWLMQGSARAGWRLQEEAESPWFPLSAGAADADSERYPSTSESGLGASLHVEGIAQLSPRWQIGGALSGNYSSSFEEYAGQFFLRWLIDPRSGVFSSDLSPIATDDLR